jgi:hypothetical protein
MISTFQKGVITFDASLKTEILSCFNKTVDEEGYLIEADNHLQRVVTVDGDEIPVSQFGGIIKGSERYIKSDLPSLIELLDTLE